MQELVVVFDRDIIIQGSFIHQEGIDHGGEGELIAETPETVVVKWPRHKTWQPIGSFHMYDPPSIVVYEILASAEETVRGRRRLSVRPIIGWEAGRRKRDDS